MEQRVLFVLKMRGGYDTYGCEPTYSGENSYYFSSGLYWSAKFVSDMLDKNGVCAKLVEVVDNNQIDAEIFKFKPTVVIIEALWVVPEKFDVLQALWPDVTFIVRLHSNVPFLAQEGVAISWIKGYASRGVLLAVNQERAFYDLQEILGSSALSDPVLYLPNYYPVRRETVTHHHHSDHIRIGCYGAIRPLKNQLIQAVAAIRFADDSDFKLYFHINSTRVEAGENVLKNLRALFADTRHVLVEECWMTHKEFLDTLSHLDLGMQVSLSETFNIVSADFVSAGVPIVVSPEIEWAISMSMAKPTDSESITQALERVYENSFLNVLGNRESLKKFSRDSKDIWLDVFGD
jgi:hypothetical protein